MEKFCLRLLFFLFPLLAIPAFLYVVFDPFKVLYHYDTYYKSGQPMGIFTNRGFVSVETFKNEYKRYKYDSFIFGNSRSHYFEVKDWSTHINSPSIFHCDAFSENLEGVVKFLVFLDKNGVQIKNALFIFDHELLENIKSESHLLIPHPELSDETKLSFHWNNFRAFLDQNFFKAFLDYTISGQIKPYMKSSKTLDDIVLNYDVVSNELSLAFYEQMIKRNPNEFYDNGRMQKFYKRSDKEQELSSKLQSTQKLLLKQLKKVLDRHNTNFRVVISPLYDQKKINTLDIEILKALFGKDNIYDFSGKNAITENFYNYYEASHYRPHVAKYIMDSIYSSNKLARNGER